MADFDPLAALKSQDKFTLQMGQTNGALQELMTRGGLQDLLARKENKDKLGQIEATGTNNIVQALTANDVPTARATQASGLPGLTDILNQNRNAKQTSQIGSGVHALGQAGIFPKEVEGKTPLDLPKELLVKGDPIGVSTNRALAESKDTTTRDEDVEEYVDAKGKVIPGITKRVRKSGVKSEDEQKGGRVGQTRATLDSLVGKGVRIGQVNGKRSLIWNENGKQVYQPVD